MKLNESMILYVSKLIRQINNISTPRTCYALQHIPESLNEVCDCKLFCKFGPKGNSPIFNINYPEFKNLSADITINKTLKISQK